MSARPVLVARLDHLGDVILSGPAVRAVAASGARVTYLCSPTGAPAARALPGVAEVRTARAPWIDAEPEAVERERIEHLVGQLEGFEEVIIFTSFHQSPLPLALLARMAGVGRVAAISVDYPGSLLDVRHRVEEDIHEVERGLSLAAAAGYPLPAADDRRLVLDLPPAGRPDGLPDRYVVVHPGASVPARAWAPERNADLVRSLLAEGWGVVVTGGPAERSLTAAVAAGAGGAADVVDLGGRCSLPDLAAVLTGAAAVVCGNTGPAHLAAAMGTPVVSIYAPTVPAVRWRPWMVPCEVLGDQGIACAGCRARVCPVPGHPCVSDIPLEAVVAAVERLATTRVSHRAAV